MLEIRSRSIMSSVATGSKPPDFMITLVPPSSSGGRPPASPAMWNSGAPGAATRSSGCQPMWVTWLKTCITRLWWVSTAPLGRPVVPDVYMMKAGSSSSTTTSSGSSLAAASAASKSSPICSTVEHGRCLLACLRRELGHRGVDDERRRARVGEHVGDLVGDQPEVHRDHDRPEPHSGQVRLPGLHAVEREHRDPVARPDPALGECAGQPGDPLVEFGVAAPCAVEAEGGDVRRLPCVPGQLVAHGHAAALQSRDRDAHGISSPGADVNLRHAGRWRPGRSTLTVGPGTPHKISTH